MKLLFVKSGKIGSRIIQWGLKSDCSHFAVCFDEDESGDRGIVFHSIGSGTQLQWLKKFLEHYEVVHCLKVNVTHAEEESLYSDLLDAYVDHGYDYLAILWWVWRGSLRRFFGVPLPQTNALQINGFEICTAIAGGISFVREWAQRNRVDLEMISPEDLFYGISCIPKLIETDFYNCAQAG